MFRRYSIIIEASGEAAEHLNGIEKVLGCSISEPSNWVEYGSTKERGLTFLDENGRELTSPVFVHQPYFIPMADNDESEVAEIRSFVVDALARHRSVKPDDILIKVAEYNGY